ncbi:radical SAM protein [uncultured Eubacterium sp.]|uniref:radical SAM protein n=1 Tax=uncultured Eubacterium sp. TaxID=165185 RepID=UPI002590A31B|nr:radical SAM protein [uncultured Eubacterium sp.]
MKLSEFNIISKYGEKLLVFNSLKGSLLCVNDRIDIKNLLNGNLSELNSNKLQTLIDNGIVVDDDLEDIMAQKKLFDYIYDNRLELVIMPTMQCNFRCVYCYEDFKMGSMSEDALKSLIKYLYRTLSRHSGLVIDWFGGEPLLALSQMEKISEQAIKLCSYLKIPYYSYITTNGYLLTPKNMQKLLKMHIYNIQITIDGNEEFHNKNRVLVNGEDTFKRIIDNLTYIRDNINNPALNISIRCNLSKSSLNDIPNFMNQLNDWFGKDKRFSFYFHPIENWGGNSIKHMQRDLLNGADLFFETLSKCKSKIEIRNDFKKLSLMPICNTSKINRFVIDPKLNIYKCSLYRNDPCNQIGKLENGKMILDEKKVAHWSFNIIENYEKCKNECQSYANCFAKLCPYKMNERNSFKCMDNVSKISKILELDYKYSSEKYINI